MKNVNKTGPAANPQQGDVREVQPFSGLLENEGHVYRNWGLSRSTKPAVYVEPLSYADVQAVVCDTQRFPTPVHPVGSRLSVSSTIVNDGGTMLCTRKLDEILGLEHDETGRHVVRVQAGCRLKKLNMWLQARGVEIPFQAEIGEATVGSAAVGDTKESSLDGPGYFSAHVVALSYVDERGELCTLSADKDGAAFHEFKCSFGLSGIVVECQLEVRTATLCRSEISLAAFESPEELAAGLIRMREESDALLAIVFLHQLAAFFDQRYKAGPGSTTPASSQPACDRFRAAKRLAIQHGFDGVEVPQPKGLVYSRADFVNEYWRPAADERRLDFQYYEHDIARLTRVIVESFEFTKAFEQRTGFAPKGWAAYFVQRPEKDKKPFGLYSGGPGVSFSFDPFSSNPTDPLWQAFAQQYNRLAIHTLGGNASPIQTQWLQPGDVKIPRKLARPRFTTKYYEPFLC
ncbi:FAD-binding oxidoreductase [Crenobacter cavernae]|uniref:FAD-binding oxidoreductase n=1 Tax=Crenobacter cavernae TaxID=2290923 RepID=A0A345Y5P1_9NEIS|nr:FAD-dependent oxidoreductase [Crenobacter cavernae]AXK39243.1 FAD-binding oxidoreductase [Crenobacter cavernae]